MKGEGARVRREVPRIGRIFKTCSRPSDPPEPCEAISSRLREWVGPPRGTPLAREARPGAARARGRATTPPQSSGTARPHQNPEANDDKRKINGFTWQSSERPRAEIRSTDPRLDAALGVSLHDAQRAAPTIGQSTISPSMKPSAGHFRTQTVTGAFSGCGLKDSWVSRISSCGVERSRWGQAI